MPGSDEAHLKQRQLEETEGIEDILEDLGKWLADAQFSKDDKGVQLCADKGLPKASQQLLNATGFGDKVVERS